MDQFNNFSQYVSSAVVPVQYETIKIKTVNTQHFIIVNLKQLHVSPVQGSHHQAIYFRNIREENYIAEETVSISSVAY